ncbi:protein C8orf37 homolog isoform X2 [Rhinatrema bivittatum]|uniref:protein C8orf37 homolog isoform X2 n=1 Tax=Rhinatrema bivittatum TaxID=194408 RepID=UPI00112823ED|nr:protein C8orf37 homolog isoform X2 [Rhinatrema bivittatum]
MADDLDELLDEVESKFCKAGVLRAEGAGDSSKGGHPEGAERNRSSNSIVKNSKEDDDIEDLIEDIFHNVSFDEKLVKPRAHASDQSAVSASIQINSKKTCDHLRCTACDFSVAIHDDYQWDISCDYLFFRNNMPEFSRLQEKMIKKKGTRAYACQCSWRSIQELTDLATDQHLRWVCGKHAE